jgi:hypothetical protein
MGSGLYYSALFGQPRIAITSLETGACYNAAWFLIFQFLVLRKSPMAGYTNVRNEQSQISKRVYKGSFFRSQRPKSTAEPIGRALVVVRDFDHAELSGLLTSFGDDNRVFDLDKKVSGLLPPNSVLSSAGTWE